MKNDFKDLLDSYSQGAPDAGYTPAIGNALACLLKLGKAYKALAEAECNRHLTAREMQRQDRLGHSIRVVASNLPGVQTVTLSGDPRGCVVKLVMVSGYANDFGREGICVY